MRERHGEAFGSLGTLSPDTIEAALPSGGGFGRGQRAYYDNPVLQKPHWGWEIIGYFFVGGASAASSALAAIAERCGEPEDATLVRNARYTALVGAALSGALLVKDLGRPERFLHMLRVVKLKSPMSVGVYALSTFSTASALAALEQLHTDGILRFNPFGWIPRPLRLAIGAVSAAYMASYTGVLVAATAIPVWYVGRRHIPPIFVLSAATTGSALQSLLLALTGRSPHTRKKLETIELLSSLAEAALLVDYERRSGEVGQALFGGTRGARLKRWTLGTGIALPALLSLPSVLSRAHESRQHRFRTILATTLALIGGYVLRDAVVTSGRTSAGDARAYLRHPE